MNLQYSILILLLMLPSILFGEPDSLSISGNFYNCEMDEQEFFGVGLWICNYLLMGQPLK